MDKPLIILHNIRSNYNVGAIIRTAAAFGDFGVICTGYTPYPSVSDDSRLPHQIRKQNAAIAKTALGSEKLVTIQHIENLELLLNDLRRRAYSIYACEQTKDAISIADWQPANMSAVIFGNEPHGIDEDVLRLVPDHIEIVQHGAKESLNVSAAAAIVLYTWSSH